MNSRQYTLASRILIFVICLGLLSFVSCKSDDETNDKNNNNNPPQEEIINEHITYDILEDTIYQTTVHIFKSNIQGPKVAIVGGIHGDEIAGWSTALNLVKRNNFKGEVMIIPQANILADTLQQRYPGQKSNNIYNGIKYSDLNRTFPGSATGTPTEQIANAIALTVESFGPDYFIDLHESRRSSTDPVSPLLGDLLIYGNTYSALFCEDITYEFNHKHLLPGETAFGTDTNAPKGSFCNYFGTTYPDSIVFTIETNREYSTTLGKDTADLSRRIEQQTQLLDIFFSIIWK